MLGHELVRPQLLHFILQKLPVASAAFLLIWSHEAWAQVRTITVLLISQG